MIRFLFPYFEGRAKRSPAARVYPQTAKAANEEASRALKVFGQEPTEAHLAECLFTLLQADALRVRESESSNG